jgi:hypothetical protein
MEGKYKITALANGETVFTAKSKYNTSIELKIRLTVSDVLVESITIETNFVARIIVSEEAFTMDTNSEKRRKQNLKSWALPARTLSVLCDL